MGGVRADAGASGARSGSWCGRKSGSPFEFRLYELTDDGSESVFDLESLSGFPVWMMFFTSWCPPCNTEAPAIVSMADAYRAQGVKVIGIDVQEKPEPVRNFVKKHGIDFPIAMDTTGSVFRGMGGKAFHRTCFSTAMATSRALRSPCSNAAKWTTRSPLPWPSRAGKSSYITLPR